VSGFLLPFKYSIGLQTVIKTNHHLLKTNKPRLSMWFICFMLKETTGLIHSIKQNEHCIAYLLIGHEYL
jgi:hypothetical protein